jgi:hypothetical protein
MLFKNSMVVLLCSLHDDYVLNLIDWLKHFKCDYVKIDFNDYTYSDFDVIFKNNKLKITLNLHSKKSIDFDEVSFFLYRSGRLLKKNLLKSDAIFHYQIASTYYEFDQDTVIDFVYSQIEKKSLGWPNQKPLNKLSQLLAADKCGLNIPETFILNSKKRLKENIVSNEIVIKAIQENVFYQTDDAIFVQRVKLVNLDKIPDFFESTLFQQKIDKQLEIRCFYLDGNCYCIASISEYETIDGRDNYDNQSYVKIELKKEVILKIQYFMNEIGLKSGSLDLILSKENNILFLEVNPEGQYEWVSVFGGYNIDKILAEFLNEKEENHLKIKELLHV